MESQKSLVELIKAKEEEFEKLTKVKEMLQGQNTKLKSELDDTKKEIEKLRKSIKEKKGMLRQHQKITILQSNLQLYKKNT